MKPASNLDLLFQALWRNCAAGVAVFCSMATGGGLTARAFTSADADTLFEAHTKAFYEEKDGHAWFKESTEGGKVSYWMRAEQMEMVLDAYERTRNAEQMVMFTNLFRGFLADHGKTWERNEYNDDIMWMVIACVRAHLLSSNAEFLDAARTNFDLCYTRAASPDLGGGLWWKTDNRSKNACVNGPGAIAAFLLSKATGEADYLTKARDLFLWERATLFDPATGRVSDNIRVNGRVSRTAFTYNQGTFVGAANLLGYHDEARLAATFTMNELCSDGYLPPAGEKGDGGGFNGIGARWIARFVRDRGEQAAFEPWLQKNAEAAWQARRSSDNLSWCRWPQPTPSDRRYSWGCSSAVVVLQVVRPPESAKPAISTRNPGIENNKAKGGVWWSLQPVVRHPLPDGPEINPIDRFINAEHRNRGIEAVGAADKSSLLRRTHLDLIGIPPSPAEQEAFLEDPSADAHEKVVDQLLANEQHAVRYARHWLDVLRYADADERMTAAPGIHLWRDWVINALHDDVPYDQFVQIQLTGHRSNERTQMSATGYRSRKDPRSGDQFALGFLARGTGENPQDLAISATDTVSTAFMGMTVGCAKCHDHFYDPISQKDFYAMKALFDPLVLRKVTLASAAELIASGKGMAEAEKKRAPLEKALNDFIAPYKAKLYEERVLMLPAEAQAVIRKPEKQRTVGEQKIADDYFPILRIDGDKLSEAMSDEARRQYQELQRKVNAEGPGDNGRRGPTLPVFYTVEVDRLREQEKSYILTSGDPLRPELDHEVKPGWPFATAEPDFRDGRLEAFADWLTAPENPLFARVAVNRLWQWHFGEGLLRSSSDFGELGGKPSHPALLDWLASEFVRLGFSMKHMHRLMVTSDAYKRASEAGGDSAESQKIDARNSALWHFRLQRLEAEPIWDSMHAAVGDLDLKVGGPSFDAREGGGGSRRRGNSATNGDTNSKRRGAYMVRGYSPSREVTPNFLQAFDVDDGREPCPMRTQTVTAPQALFLMNSTDIDKASTGLGARLQKETKSDLPSAVDLAYRLVLTRPPSTAEMNNALAYLENDAARLKELSWLLFNLDEFIYVK